MMTTRKTFGRKKDRAGERKEKIYGNIQFFSHGNFQAFRAILHVKNLQMEIIYFSMKQIYIQTQEPIL